MNASQAAPSPDGTRLDGKLLDGKLPWIVVAGAVFLLYFFLPSPGAPSSALSRESGGWWGARAYLEARGVDVELLDAPLGTALDERGDRDPGVLVLALPWQRFPDLSLEQDLRRHLRSGGDLLVAYDGAAESPSQTFVFDALGLSPILDIRDDPPLSPRAWWRYRTEKFTLHPGAGRDDGDRGEGPALTLPAFASLPTAPLDAEVLYSAEGQTLPVIFEFKRHGGRVLALPAKLFANAHLADVGHADVLEATLARFDGPWLFDEYHHGLVRPELLERSDTSYAWDLFIAHLLLIYGLAVFALGRSFGPAWREETLRTGSTSDFLRSLGVLHHQLGHHRDAARRLLERAAKLDPGLDVKTPDGAVPLDPDAVTDGPTLTDFADRLARLRHPRSPAKGKM